MTIDKNDMLNSILEMLSQIDYIHPGDIPNIDLYMDQVTTFMDKQLASTKRYEDDKILTKTMINNYAKNHLLPPPVKKKYSREHVLLLIFIYYFKNILSIKDIEVLLKPVTEKYFEKAGGIDLSSLYEKICEMERERIESFKETVKGAYEAAASSFGDTPDDERDFIQLFAFICNLSFDVYIKKQLIEKLIDEFSGQESS